MTTATTASSHTASELAFSPERFRAERVADWEEFDRLLSRLERGSASSLDDDELLRLPVLYRATLSSLSIARATSLDRQMLDYLDSLSMRGYFLLYGVRTSRRGKLAEFFFEGWPNAVRHLWKETLVSALIMTLAILAAHLLVTNDPIWYYQLMDGGMAAGREPGATREFLRSTLFEDSNAGKDGLYIFATFLFTHNSQVSIAAFALGFAFGIPTLFLIFMNGLSLGAMTAVFAEQGLLLEFAGCVLVISHDRWFLDRIATHILAAEGESQWTFFNGNYQEYEADKRKRLGEEGAKPKRIRYKPITR